MAQTFEQLEDAHVDFIQKQHMFFVATSPLAQSGSVNLSPKGYDSIQIIDAHTVLWLDLGGSGVETIAHLQENGRITLMFCAFEGRANILRIYGQGEAVTMDEPGFDALLAKFPNFDRARAVIKVNISSVSDSCGWGVPFYEFKEDREQLNRYVENQPIEAWKQHRYDGNAESIDGLPGLVRVDADNKDRSQ